MSRPARALHDDMTEVLQVLIRYLEGCHYGDLETLRSAVALVRAAAAWYVDATCVCGAECWP